MTVIYNKSAQKEKRRYLRKESTEAERMLWEVLRGKKLGVKFRRQYGIAYYIADFCCVEKKLIIEIDGAGHNKKEQKFCDKERSEVLKELGFRILRFWNGDIENNLDKVIKQISFYISN